MLPFDYPVADATDVCASKHPAVQVPAQQTWQHKVHHMNEGNSKKQ